MKKMNSAKKELNNKKKIFNVKEFAKKNKGFIIAVIATVIIILTLVFVQYNPDLSAEKTTYARELFLINQSDLNAYIESITIEQQNVQETTLDDDYLASAKADVEWLIAKEKIIYNSKPSTNIFAKEVAFTLFAQTIMQVNMDYSIQITEPEYEKEISLGLKMDYNIPQMLTEQEINESFSSETERETYFSTLKNLYAEYFSSKKQFINSIDSTERKYVEAKKLIWLSYTTQ